MTNVPLQEKLLSTVHTYLVYKPEGSTDYKILCHINSFPSPDGGIPSSVYSKNLSSRTPRSAEGWYEDDSSAMPFTADYDLKTYKALKALEGEVYDFGIWIGGTENTDASTGKVTATPTGEYGKFQGKGTIVVSKDEGETDGFQTMSLQVNKISPWTEVSTTEPA